jgi:hypothetical protein
LFANPPAFGNTGAINVNLVKITFGTTEEFKSGLVALKLDFNVTDLVSIVDVQLEEVAAASGLAFKIGAKTKYAGTDIFESYADSLAVVGAWKITKVSDGSSVSVSSVAKDTTNKCWTVTAAAGPTSGTELKIELQDPTTLAGLTTAVEGIESVYVKVTAP